MWAPIPLLAAGPAVAWDASQPEVHVVAVPAGAIRVDGVLDEAAWQTAPPVPELLRHRPSRGGPPPCTTEIRFLQDARNLYVGARVHGCDYRIRARLAAREQINQDDQIGVYFDTYGDGRTGYLFYVNPRGVQQDIRTSNGEWSFSWNTAFSTRGRVTEDGYEIEMAFPWRSLKYPAGEREQTWGVVLTRVVPHLGAKYSFPNIVDRHPRVMTLAAPLVGVRPAPQGSGLELIPGLTAGQAWPREDGSRTGLDPWHQVLRPSLDLRYGITPDLSLTAAVNPDFSQVEADIPDVRVNPRFAFRFPETRPFFLDGFEYFEDRSNTLYTRSINAPIYGLKLSGREGPIAVGVLNAVDLAPLPSFQSEPTPGFRPVQVEEQPMMTSVARVRADAFGDGFVGLTYADKRPFDPPPSSRAGTFQAVAADAEIPLDRDVWWLGGSTQHSFLRGPSGPWRWGMQNEIALRRVDSLGTGLDLELRDITPDHRLETGFSPLSGVTRARFQLNHNLQVDRFVDTVKPEAEVEAALERDGDRLITAGPELSLRLADVHRLSLGGRYIDQVEGGVAVPGWEVEGGYDANPFGWLRLAPTGTVGRSVDYALLVPADTLLLAWDGALLPTSWLRLDTRASWERVAPEGPSPVQTGALVRNRLNLQFHRELGLRWIESWTDGSAEDPLLQSSVLLTWYRVPGTAAYLGVAETTDLGSGQMVERSVFAKASVLWRP